MFSVKKHRRTIL